jgi:hypothetical protein
MSEPPLDEATAEAELDDADFGDEADNATFAGEQRDRAATTPDEAEPRGRGGDGGLDQPR